MTARSLRDLSAALHELRSDLVHGEEDAREVLGRIPEARRESARNLVHYLALREHDHRELQRDLAAYGLSSLGRLEGRVLASVEELLATVDALVERSERRDVDEARSIDAADATLADHADELLGPAAPGRDTRIMVTMPPEAAHDSVLVDRMTEAGMDLARVNCAHDGAEAWSSMIGVVRDAAARRQRPGRIAMDLGGPKLRTGPIEPGPKVVKLRPARDPEGRVLARSMALLADPARVEDRVLPTTPADTAVIPVLGLDEVEPRVGDVLVLRDARDSKRKLKIVRIDDDGALLVSCRKTVYWETGLELPVAAGRIVVGELPPVAGALRVREGDELVLTADLSPAQATDHGRHRIGCTLPEALRDAEPGHRILFDDGKIEGVIEAVQGGGEARELSVKVTRAGLDGAKLKAEKGINLPDTTIRVPALTAADREHLPFVAEHADVVSLSFARSPQDVRDLIEELERLEARELGIVLKIETNSGFESLPAMLLEAMRFGPVGVMIARGDLAVEVGFERLAEVQEEILWLCEAAHAPVVWATQVLDTLARTGAPSRSEVTDAAMGRRAECVMLNKGPYIVDAIAALDSILARMGGHVEKKRSLLRRLRAWEDALED